MEHPGRAIPVQRLAHEARTVPDLFRRRALASPDRPAVYEKRSGAWTPRSWGDVYRAARQVARGLVGHGVGRGDRVAILGPTSAAWGIYDMGAQLAGAVSFGMYPQQTREQLRYLLEHSEARVVFVDGEGELATVIDAARGLDGLRAIVPWDAELAAAAAGRDARIASPAAFHDEPLAEPDVEARLAAIDPEDTAILVYTSGTTGPPKGAMLSHRNILSLLAATASLHELHENDLSLNFLPMAHVAERVLGFFGRIDAGIATAYARSVATVLDDLREVRPTLFGAVPRIFEKAYGRMYAELEKKPPAARRLFAWAVGVGKQAVDAELAGRPVPFGLRVKRGVADRLVFRRVRAAFGGRVRHFVTGAAPIAREILELFWAAGLPIYEVYGMTEATVVTHANRRGAVRLGSVGQALPPLETRIAEDGEILLRAPWVFQGYLKSPEATAETVVDGWLHTGDIGALDADGFLKITDRKKHIIITAGGKNLAPANIENAIKNQDPLISQVYAHGDRRPYVSAIVSPSPIETLEWGQQRGLVEKADVEALTRELMANPTARGAALEAALARVVADPAYAERIRDAVRRGNRDLAHVEQVRRFVVLERDFSQEHGELTPTMKLRRKAVEQAHAALIDQMYQGGGVEA